MIFSTHRQCPVRTIFQHIIDRRCTTRPPLQRWEDQRSFDRPQRNTSRTAQWNRSRPVWWIIPAQTTAY